MPETYGSSKLLAAIRPFHWTFTIFGLIPPPPMVAHSVASLRAPNETRGFPRHWWIGLVFGLHSLTYVLVSLSVTDTNNAFIEQYVHLYDLDCITRILSISSNVSVSVVQLLMQLTTLFGYRQLCCIYAAVSMLEQDIQWYCCPASGSRRDDRGDSRFRRRVAAKSGAFFVVCSITLLYTNYPLVANEMPVTHKLFTIFFDLMIEMKCVEFCVIVQTMHELLGKLHNHLIQTHSGSATLSPAALTMRLQINQNLVARVWNLVNIVEAYFTLPMLVLFLFNGLTITHTINWTYIQFTIHKYNTYRIFFTGVVMAFMLVPCWMSQCCIDTYDELGAILHNLKSRNGGLPFSMRLREYSLQLNHQKLLFSCGGYFDINLKYFGAMTIAMTTYLVILIQFKLQSDSEGFATTKAN